MACEGDDIGIRPVCSLIPPPRTVSSMDENITAILGWGIVVAIVVGPVVFAVSMVVRLVSERPVESKYDAEGGGLAGGFSTGLDAVFSPTAHEAGIERDRQTQRTAPAPAPGDPPDTIDGGSIRIDI